MDDHELLQSYASRRAEDAFRALTERHIALVYSAALRQTGNAQAAEDVTQAVFLTLARKAGTISRKTILSGWLLRTTRYAAANARRLEQRRQHYEQQAMQSYVCPTETEAAWQRIAPLLDEAMDSLGEKDRDAVVLRFFERMPLKQIATRLGISEDGAQKRVSRALEKLRLFFARHGRAVSVGAFAGALASNSVQAAPPALAATICAAVVTESAVVGSFATALVQATLHALARARWQIVAVRAGSVAVLVGLTILIAVRENNSDDAPLAEVSKAATPAPRRPTQTDARVAAPADAPTSLQPDFGQLLLRVVDSQTGAPVTNARLTLVSVAEFPQRATNTFTTDARGAALVFYSPIPVKSRSHRIEIFRDGYVPKYVSWSEYQQDSIDEIPAEYTAKLDPAVRIGGVVVDEQDAPVPGVRVVFSVSGPTPSRARERVTMMGNYHTEVTGADGRWWCSHVPPRFGMIQFRLVHPQFQERTYMPDSPEASAYLNMDRLPEADFLAGSALMQLKTGLTIAGIVTDESGQPVPGAKVTQGFDFHAPERTRITDADGSFRFGNGWPRELSLTVQAAGLAPVVTSLVVNASVEGLRFVLPVGRTLLGRVMDEAGQPIAGARIEPASPTADSRTLFEWRTRTDAEGRFSWDTAPAAQEYAVYAGGYESRKRVQLTADATEQAFRLTKLSSPGAVRIYGQVVDAETRQPPAAAQVQIWETTKEPGGGFSSFTTVPEEVGADGMFRLKTSSRTVSYALEAQADGYWPERLTNQVTGGRELWLDIELAKAPLAAGTVVTPAGEPAGGAMLVVCGHDEQAQMTHPGKFEVGSRSRPGGTVADAHGRFRLPPKHTPEVVVVAHAQGFAEVPFSRVTSNTVIALQPWGRLEGTVRLAAKPLVNETIRLGGMAWGMNRSPRVSLYLGATTDAEGRFVFEMAPPGEWKVQREINKRTENQTGLHFPAFSHGVVLAVRSGETASVALGGSGRAVVGRAVVSSDVAPSVWAANSVALVLKVPAPDAPKPPPLHSFSSPIEFEAARQAYQEQSQAYWTSDAGLTLQRLQREYRAMFAGDGSFLIEDVPPGEYTLKINLTEPPKRSDGNRFNFATLASLEKEVAIPQASTASDDTPVDLGVLQLSPTQTQRPGN